MQTHHLDPSTHVPNSRTISWRWTAVQIGAALSLLDVKRITLCHSLHIRSPAKPAVQNSLSGANAPSWHFDKRTTWSDAFMYSIRLSLSLVRSADATALAVLCRFSTYIVDRLHGCSPAGCLYRPANWLFGSYGTLTGTTPRTTNLTVSSVVIFTAVGYDYSE